MGIKERMNRTKLNIGAYHLQPYARSERHIKEIADCGVNFIICMENDRPVLDLFEKYGVGAIVSGILPGWWRGSGKAEDKEEEAAFLAKNEIAAKAFEDHPAIWGIDIGDEPSAIFFEYLGKAISLTERLFTHQFIFLNLYPNYASVAQNTSAEALSQLGTASYEEHIAKYVEKVPTNYICYDHYMYSSKSQLAYENLRIVANACRASNRSLWIVLQVNANREEEKISENQLRHQAFSAMAFGAENIIWGCWTAGWWYNNVLDEKGEKTEQYDKLRKINGEIARMGVPYMKYINLSTDFVGFKNPEKIRKVKQAPVDSPDAGIFSKIRAENGEGIIVGHMVKREGMGEALMLADAEYPRGEKEESYRILFRCESPNVRAYRNGAEIPVLCVDGGYCVEMTTCAGVLITAE